MKTLTNTNLAASWCFKMKKTSLPVDVHHSKTPLLKLSSVIENQSVEALTGSYLVLNLPQPTESGLS